MMRNGFDDIQQKVEAYFRSFIGGLLRLDGQPLKYYYWTPEFFEANGGLKFQYFTLTQGQKETINTLGKQLFDDSSIYFEVNKNSHRHDILIKNINLLFPESRKKGQSNRYEYIKEYLLWQLLDELAKNKKEKEFDTRIAELQKGNFLITYLNYLFEYTKQPSFEEFENYISFRLTNQFEELDRKLKDLDDKRVDNSILREKLSRLFVHKEDQNNLHFVFSRAGGEEKEELRELLDVMGREETGKLYRGQANSLWKLDSSLTREPNYMEHESEMYYDILSLKPDAFVNDRSVYERLITMQHFGMPTRLMDITRNPLVAIFFACNNLDQAKCDGVVYTFSPKPEDFLNFEDDDLKSLKKLFEKNGGDADGEEFLQGISFIKGVAKNQRINNQSGDFIFVGKGDDIQSKLHNLPALSIIIDAPTKKVLLEQLESLNIHGGAVYPDLTHMSNYIRNKFLSEKRNEKDFTIDIDLSAFEVADKPKSSSEKKDAKAAPKEVEKLTTDFKSNEFWTDEREADFLAFVAAHSLDQDRTMKMIEDIAAFNKPPIRSDVAKLLDPKPKLKQYDTVVQPVIDAMNSLVKRWRQEKE